MPPGIGAAASGWSGAAREGLRAWARFGAPGPWAETELPIALEGSGVATGDLPGPAEPHSQLGAEAGQRVALLVEA